MTNRSGLLKSERIGFGKFFQLGDVERLDRTCVVDPDVFVELLRQHGFKVMAGKLTLGPVGTNNSRRTERMAERTGASRTPRDSTWS
jgi:hypothetical protein